ncbi:adenylosuccinate lyase [Calorimonas adulescens]|uniref:Adenylosuccinate lyase n=1 Tax=Calorimonas adulescens TaxID=2606906 RepID=A0A5D8Q8I5_9THEO|nr:adenylosuccinate lyase [Calorimonas adulescens]TZE80792.1 adenylosuccinate lyase [Calorimonas adulescens]
MGCHSVYSNPLIERYASKEMSYIFSDDNKYSIWRKLWVALAEAEKELGLNITDEQIEEMKEHINDISYDVVAQKEAKLKHDVMAHIQEFGEKAPKARPIIHLGATSAFVDDNADLIQMYNALQLIRVKLLKCIDNLSTFALTYKDMPALGYTHFQPAQLTTVGKRACMWIQDLLLDLKELEYRIANFMLRGVKGTTGTQASFLELFNGDKEKTMKLDELVTRKLGFEKSFPVTGQTYTRKYDWYIMEALCGIAQSAHKFGNDIRLLQHENELEEPFDETQVGSSAMPYKRNPMRSERMCSLSRYIITNVSNFSITASTQWLERTLDDSANRRISIPEMFLATDGVLNLYINISSNLKVYPRIISQNVSRELPFMAVENILMRAVENGGDRQQIHEKIRKHSMEVRLAYRENGIIIDLIKKIIEDPDIPISGDEMKDILNPKNYIGLSAEQVEIFLDKYVNPILNSNRTLIENIQAIINV